jgi:cell fate regulator YaaT (PSP1 superfamily)
MGCGSCGTSSADGKPSGCQSNGGCSTGGCNRLNVFNWLSDVPFSDLGKPYPIMEITFNKGSRKDFFRNTTNHIFDKDSWVAVEGSGGYDVGQISLTGELVKLQMKKYGVTEETEMKRVLRPANERDLETYQISKQKEMETMVRSRAIAKQLNLEMKIAEVEFQADAKKVTFFYTADSRVDFRELIKVFASEFKAKVEMRQIGARQESGKVGGIGSCGRELCCSTWLTDFKTVNTTAARYQNLSINQTKLSGQCGRLKCCLNYELDTYMDALHHFPEGAEQLEVASGRVYLQKKDIFRNLMWYSFGGSNKQYPLTIERVIEVKALNADGIKPEDLGAEELQIKTKNAEKTVDMGFVNDVGQLTLSYL